MRKLVVISLLLFVAISVFSQVAKYPPKAICVFLGEKHPDFDESKFQNIDFYYVIKDKYKNPEGMLKGISEGTNLLFGKNGVFISPLKYAETANSVGEAFAHMKRNKVVTDGQEVEVTPLDDFTQTYIKKGKEMKAGKKLKSKDPSKLTEDYISFVLPDFKVTDSDGKEHSFNGLVSNDPLTMVVFQYLDTWNKPSKKSYADQIKKLSKLNNGI